MEQSAVIKSKVDISRNLNGYSFPHKLSSQEAEIIIQKVKNVFSDSKYDFTLHKINELSQSELDLLEERELMDDEFLINANGALLFNSDKTICILINGLDHIKIQVIGYNDIKGLYKIANEIDIKIDNTGSKDIILLNGEDVSKEIRTKEVTSIVSQISSIIPVREKMVEVQRKLATGKNVIVEGRDIGTVVFPNADIKIYLDASEEIRAKRRYEENIQNGIRTTYEEVLENVKMRDYNDMHKKVGALKKAEDAIVINSSNLSIGEVVKKIEDIIKEHK